MVNHNTHLAPGFLLNVLVPAPANVVVFWGLLGPWWPHSLYQMSSSRGTSSPHVARTPRRSHSLLLGTRLSHQSTTRHRAAAFQTLCSPCLYRVLMEFKHSPFSFLPLFFSPYSCFHFFTFSPAAFGGGCFSHTLPPSLSSLCKQKQLPALCSFSPPPVHLSLPCTC